MNLELLAWRVPKSAVRVTLSFYKGHETKMGVVCPSHVVSNH